VRSIRTRLLWGLLAGVVIAQVCIYLLIYARIEDEIDDLFDSELERSALSATGNGSQSSTPLPDRRVENPQQEMTVTAWLGSDAPPGDFRNTPAGFSKRMIHDRQWRLFALADGDKRVVAAQPADIRDIAARKITLHAIGPSMAVLPLAALMIWIAISYGLQPLARITQDLRRRSHRDLSPIDIAALPPDLLPVAHALNELMQRLAETISTQRTFIADAAHELLTPLTALKLQAQMLARSKSPLRQREAMTELQAGISRTLKLAQGLLTLARHDSEADLHYSGTFDLSLAVRNSLSIHIRLAEEKRLTIETKGLEETMVRGNLEAAAILCSTLIDNAVKYSDYGGNVRIGIHGEDSHTELRIEDSGPGIPVEDRDRVFDRFYRRRDALASGSGLGLAIAKEIATRCGARVALGSSNDLRGLQAGVYFVTSDREAVGV
jgi:two-component system, OmpR family, sensor kinase